MSKRPPPTNVKAYQFAITENADVDNVDLENVDPQNVVPTFSLKYLSNPDKKPETWSNVTLKSNVATEKEVTILDQLQKAIGEDFEGRATEGRYLFYFNPMRDEGEDYFLVDPTYSKTDEIPPPQFELRKIGEKTAIYRVRDFKLDIIELKPKRGGGAGFGARADKPGEYHWYGDKALGYALGLKRLSYVGVMPTEGNLLTIDKAENANGYYRTNTPSKVIAESNIAKTATKNNQRSEILYYKKLNNMRAADEEPFALSPAKPAKPEIPNRTAGFLEFALEDLTIFKASPSSKVSEKQTSENKTVPTRVFKTARVKKVRGVDLRFGKSKKREDAGTVMFKQLVDQDTITAYQQWSKTNSPTNTNKLPATVYGNYILSISKDAAESWKNYYTGASKITYNTNKIDVSKGNSPQIKTDQEWCHLVYHAGGGQEMLENFVCGTHYANTEQLAMEMGLQTGNYKNLGLNVSAYRLPGTEMAAWIRYKIYAGKSSVPTERIKVFDHVFDGQNESFDRNEYNILMTTVQRVVAEAHSELNAYKARINRKIEARDQKAVIGKAVEDLKATWGVAPLTIEIELTDVVDETEEKE